MSDGEDKLSTPHADPADSGAPVSATGSLGRKEGSPADPVWVATLFDALLARIAVLDRQGIIRGVNRAWREFVALQGAGGLLIEGANYLEICASRRGTPTETPELGQGIQSLIEGKQVQVVFESGRSSAFSQPTLLSRVILLPGGGQDWLAVLHETGVVPIASALQPSSSLPNEVSLDGDGIWRIAHDIQTLERMATLARRTVADRLIDGGSLREVLPTVFDSLVGAYGEILELALDQRQYKTSHAISEKLHVLASRLGMLNVGPRDVVEIHNNAYQQKSTGSRPVKVQAYLAEGRLLLLELMGYLASHYRKYAVGIRKGGFINALRQATAAGERDHG